MRLSMANVFDPMRVDKQAGYMYRYLKFAIFPMAISVALIIYFLGAESVSSIVYAIGTATFVLPLAIEGLNVMSNVFYKALGKTEGLFASICVGVVALGLFNIPVISNMAFFGMISGVSLIASIIGFIYIILPNDPIWDLPFGFLFTWVICVGITYMGLI